MGMVACIQRAKVGAMCNRPVRWRQYGCMPPIDLDSLLSEFAKQIAEYVAAALQVQQAHADEWICLRQCPEQRAIRRAIRAGEIKAYKFSKKLWLRRSELDEWIRRHPGSASPVSAGHHAEQATDPITRAVAAGRLRRIR